MKNLKRCAVILIVILALISTMAGTYAIYSSESTSHGTVTARAFNISSTFQENIEIQIWLGDTEYWYFTAENTRNGYVATSDIALDLIVELKSVNNNHLVGLEVTLEECVEDYFTGAKTWQSATDGAIVSLDDADPNNYLFGQSYSDFIGGMVEKKQYRLKFTLPDNYTNRVENGFYDQDFNVLNRKSAVDLTLTFTELI